MFFGGLVLTSTGSWGTQLQPYVGTELPTLEVKSMLFSSRLACITFTSTTFKIDALSKNWSGLKRRWLTFSKWVNSSSMNAFYKYLYLWASTNIFTYSSHSKNSNHIPFPKSPISLIFHSCAKSLTTKTISHCLSIDVYLLQWKCTDIFSAWGSLYWEDFLSALFFRANIQ